MDSSNSDKPLTAADLRSLVERHVPLVKRIAYHLISRLPPSVHVEDLIQAGMIGLLEAARLHDQALGASFETYAGIRIRGAMLDELRRYDWAPRSVHRKSREVAEAIRSIEARSGRDARDSEVAAHLNISLSEYHQILQDSLTCQISSIEELLEQGHAFWDQYADGKGGPVEGLAKEGFVRALGDAIAGLPERERAAVLLYYEEEQNLREIGEILGVTESRVCQIQGQALLRLRARLSGWLDDGRGPPSRWGSKKRSTAGRTKAAGGNPSPPSV